MGQDNNKKIPWVKGNTLNLAVPLQLVTANNGQTTRTDYIPPEGSDIHVYITSNFGSKEYPYTINGNVVSFKDDGTLKIGCYGIEITVSEPQTGQVNGQKRRTFKREIHIHNSLEELGEFPDGEILLDAAIFIQGQKGDKGDKGDPFTYEDFTPEQIVELQKPATDAATEVAELERAIEGHETTRQENEQTRQQNESTRQQNEQIRIQDENARVQEFAQLKSEAQQATNDANSAASLAAEKAQLAQQKAEYAEAQGDYAKRKADEIDDAKGDYQNLGARLDAMDADIDSRFERITQEQFNEIFS